MHIYNFDSGFTVFGHSVLLNYFSVPFQFWNFYCHIYKLRQSLFSPVQPNNEAILLSLHVCYSVLNFKDLFFIHSWNSIFLLTLSICSCMLFTFSIKSHSQLIRVLKMSGLIIPVFLPHLTLILMLVGTLQTVCFVLFCFTFQCASVTFCWKADWHSLQHGALPEAVVRCTGAGWHPVVLWPGLCLRGSLYPQTVRLTGPRSPLHVWPLRRARCLQGTGAEYFPSPRYRRFW